MHKVWVDLTNGDYGRVTDIRVLEVHWWDEFTDLFESLDFERRIQVAKAFGIGGKQGM